MTEALVPGRPSGALGREIADLIAAEGPIGIGRYMALALGHPVHGYYRSRDPFGAAGDFTTAPEISQMFGELVGLWAGAVWLAMDRPPRIAVVELGPGRGTLLADALRAARVVPGFLQAMSLHLVETSPVLAERQRETLADIAVPLAWHASSDDVPAGPAIVLANEFLDALPIRQLVRAEAGWHERVVGLDAAGGLAFGLAPHPDPDWHQVSGRRGEIREIGIGARSAVASLARRLVRQGGAALFVDYGHAGGSGDTLQAVRRHRFVDPLLEPGEADITAHVDFRALARIGHATGATVHGPAEQGAFLSALGIRERAARLAAGADPGDREAIGAALDRLTGRETGRMGALFKAFALSHPSLPELPGLSRAPIGTDLVEPSVAAEAAA